MALQVYDNIYVFMNGVLLQESTQVQISWEGDDQDIFTLVKGFAGISPSPVKIVIQLTNVAPPTGSEFDAPGAFIAKTKQVCKLQKGATGETIEVECFVRAPATSAGVGQVTNENYSLHGEAKSWS
jgi:hypothetical protein